LHYPLNKFLEVKMVRHLRFSSLRVIKFIDNLPNEKSVDFGDFLKLGGSRNQIVAFLKNYDSIEREDNSKWKKKEV